MGAAAVGSGVLGFGESQAKAALTATYNGKTVTDIDIANFALNLEYLEAEYYLHAIGSGLQASETNGVGPDGKSSPGGRITPNRAVPFKIPAIKQYAINLAHDERAHVLDLRNALGSKAVARPDIDLTTSFTTAAIAAGIIQPGQTFDPFANDDNFLLGSFVFEDVGVTAYHGAAPYIQNSGILIAASGILAVEAYHAGTIRTALLARGASNPFLITAANKISALRTAADGSKPYGNETPLVSPQGQEKTVAADPVSAIAFSRTFDEVLRIVYLGKNPGQGGGFFPSGTTGLIR